MSDVTSGVSSASSSSSSSLSSPRIMGLGYGLFLLIFVAAFILFILVATYRSQKFGMALMVCSSIYGLLLLILLVPKKVDPAKLRQQSKPYSEDDIKYLVRLGLTLVNLLGFLLNGLSIFTIRIWRPVFGKEKPI